MIMAYVRYSSSAQTNRGNKNSGLPYESLRDELKKFKDDHPEILLGLAIVRYPREASLIMYLSLFLVELFVKISRFCEISIKV